MNDESYTSVSVLTLMEHARLNIIVTNKNIQKRNTKFVSV